MALIIPLFIPHRGCPHQCSFCNQESITGKDEADFDSHVTSCQQTIRDWLARPHRKNEVEVAFYGGSFSCLPEEEQHALLELVAPFIAQQKVKGIRISTRPDCISADIALFLKSYGVSKVELGVQSLNDQVLTVSKRGHSVGDVIESVSLLKKANIQVGIQLMAGLPGETTVSFLQGVQRIISLKPDFVRLYPVLVVKNSELEKKYGVGSYVPLSMNKAVALSVLFYKRMITAGIKVIRIGLQPSEELEKTVLAGPYHPAFGELVQSRIWLQKIRKIFKNAPAESKVTLHISDRDLSSVQGIKKINIQRLHQLGLEKRFTIEKDKDRERGSYRFSVLLV